MEKPNLVIKKGRILSFKYAFEGIASAIKQEPNLKIHIFFAFLVILASFYLDISHIEKLIVYLLIGLVITLELTNTAIESVVNHFTQESHPGAKLAKDISAGAVLVLTITSVVIGLAIFIPYLSPIISIQLP